jgi:general secretion pathway protein G
MTRLHQLRDILEARVQADDRRRRRDRRGMTLMEVMIVIALIVLLMGVLSFGILELFSQGQSDAAALQIQRINERAMIYKVKKKKAPSSMSDIYKNEPVPADPWGNEYVLRSGGKKGYDIISFGPDGSEGGGDDIKLSDNE